jgi:hypothetical protein
MFGQNKKYEYTTIQTAIDFSPEDAKLDASGLCKLITLNLNKPMMLLPENLNEVRGGHWEIISHTFLLLGNHLIVSFLARRPRQKNT